MRLSALQRRIIDAIANRTINTLECPEGYEHASFLAWSTVFQLSYAYWEPDENQRLIDLHEYSNKDVRSQRVAVSRSIHNLHGKGLIGALALAWFYLEKGHKDLWRWQGGGPRARCDVTGEPRFSMLCLTEEGWKVARDLFGPNIGKCEHTLGEVTR